ITYYTSLDGGSSWEGYGDLHDSDAHNANGFVDIFVDANKNVHSCYSTEREAAFNAPAIRYMRIENNNKVRDILVTDKGEIRAEHLKLGLSSVAASEDGQFVMITYVTGQDGGDLFARLSTDGGQTWGDRELIASGMNTLEGRSRQYIKAHGYRFYLVYPSGGIKFRTYQIAGHGGPSVQINGPYAGEEGSPIEFSAAGSNDPDGIAMFAWDWDNDGIFDDSTSSETISHTFLDDYNGEVALRARGIISGMSTETTPVTVLNVAPVVNLGADQETLEGINIQFIPQIIDPGISDTYMYSWNFGDGTTSSESQPQHAFPDNGAYTVTVIVRDDDGGEGTGSITVTTENQPPIADAGGPYNARPNEEFALTGSANDPGTADILTFAWDLDANGTFETNGQTVNRQYQNDGTYEAILQVTDDDGAAGIDTALIIIGSAAPVITAVPNQTINEGENFTPIELDNYVTDPDNPVDAITWLSEGNIALVVSMANRVATVQAPHPDWFGAETIRFIAIDPGTEADSVDVTFTINPINDAPTVTGIPAQTRNEGQAFTSIYLNNFVQDIDNNPAEIFWTTSGNSALNISITGNVATVAPADSEWAGTETLTFIAHDPSNATGQTTSNFTVIPVNDPPQINNFPDMEFTQYQEILAINLDNTVFDPDNSDSELSWLFFG
ncbi:PKD domain-containing protein, partial [bacterium]|nr:PKD domain-containing protein [bacterium]